MRNVTSDALSRYHKRSHCPILEGRRRQLGSILHNIMLLITLIVHHNVVHAAGTVRSRSKATFTKQEYAWVSFDEDNIRTGRNSVATEPGVNALKILQNYRLVYDKKLAV